MSCPQHSAQGRKGKENKITQSFFLNLLHTTFKMTYTTHPGLLRLVNDNNQTADGTVSPLPPAQSLRTIDPRTFAKSQPAAALALLTSTDND